jgi:hypothetical protein
MRLSPNWPLERRDVVRDDRLRVAELEAGRRERAVHGDRVERPQAAQIVHRYFAYYLARHLLLR